MKTTTTTTNNSSLDPLTVATSVTDHEVPGWFGDSNQGAGITVADLTGTGRKDLVVFHIDHPSGGNHGYYRIGQNLKADGTVAAWSDPIQVPGWFGDDNQGGGIAVADLKGTGRKDLIVFHIDHPSDFNRGYYRIGENLHLEGGKWTVEAWTEPILVSGENANEPGWFGTQTQGTGIAVADLTGCGKKDLVIFQIDHPSGGNHGYYRFGRNLSATGKAERWTSAIQIPGWFGDENQGGGITFRADNGVSLVVFHIDHPNTGNRGYYRTSSKVDPGIPLTWSDVQSVPGSYGMSDAGGDVALVNFSGQDYLINFYLMNPGGGNRGYYNLLQI